MHSIRSFLFILLRKLQNNFISFTLKILNDIDVEVLLEVGKA